MAKLIGELPPGGARTQSLGPGYTIRMWRGVPVVQRRTPAKKKKLSPKQKAAIENFRHLSNVAKYVCHMDYQAALDMSANTQYLWRDLIYMMASGRLFRFSTPDGTEFYSLAARTSTSDLLDVLSPIPGTMMWRGPNFWEAIPPGSEGQILTNQGHATPPIWLNPAAGGGSLATTLSWDTTQTTSNVWPRYAQFQTTHFQDWACFNPAVPDTFTLPGPATRFRVNACIQYTAGASANTFAVSIRDASDGSRVPNSFPQITTRPASTYSDRMANLSTGWIPKNDIAAIKVLIDQPGTITAGQIANTTLTIEVDRVTA